MRQSEVAGERGRFLAGGFLEGRSRRTEPAAQSSAIVAVLARGE